MGSIVISTNLTLDGVSQDPTGEEDPSIGGWFLRISAGDREAWADLEIAEANSAAALLLGGRSYAWFAQRWVNREDAWGTTLTSLPKFVVRSSPGRSDWGPTTVLDGDLESTLRALKAQVDGDIVVYASYQLVNALLAHALVDEVRLVVFPSVNGGGGRLFGDAGASLALREVRQVGSSLVFLRYDVQASR